MSTRHHAEQGHHAAVARRAKVAAMRLSGVHNQRRIAEALGVAPSTIARDVAALDLQWRAEAAADTASLKALTLARYERLMQRHWPDALGGSSSGTAHVLQILSAERALLGLDSPLQVDITERLMGLAATYGLDPDEVVAEAMAILWPEKGKA